MKSGILNNSFVKVTLFVLALIFLFTVSEIIFILRNRPHFFSAYYLLRAQWTADRDIDKSLGYIFVGSKKYQRTNPKDTNPYPENFLISSDIKKGKDSVNQIKEYLNDPQIVNLYIQGRTDYSRIIYDISLIAYKNKDYDLFVALLKHNTIVDIGMSYWPVELANYYNLSNNSSLAFEILENCKKIPKTTIHCGQFEEYLKSDDQTFEVGFLSESVEQIYNKN